MLIDRIKYDIHAKITYFAIPLIGIVILLCNDIFSFKDYIYIIILFGLIYFFPTCLFIFTSRVIFSEDGISLKFLFVFEKKIKYKDILSYSNNSEYRLSFFCPSLNSVTLYLSNGEKISISPKNIEFIRTELEKHLIKEKSIDVKEHEKKKVPLKLIIIIYFFIIVSTNILYFCLISKWNLPSKSVAVILIVINFILAFIFLLLMQVNARKKNHKRKQTE